MVLMPKRVKYRKLQRGQRRGIATTGASVSFGEFGLKSLENGWIKNTQIEAVRVILARQMHKGGKLWIRIFPDKPFTKKPPEVTMGAGKGDVAYFVASVSPGRVLFEVDGLSKVESLEVLRIVSSKMSVKTKLISKLI